ncbi:hypothetical protein GAGA_3618 [Paraglaciecola agarilytica NO2]|uniref:Transposase n=1 Tax=Paraglaciecola agarilytica NO2 TaxID=1125747 RepID=A0ABQ0IAN2_9ALTE|nr:hypothetical protein GAGA_3618 [Paraglaciecola agarilytica NO2]
MQIEETFRDIKSPQYGMVLRHSSSQLQDEISSNYMGYRPI